MTVQQGIDDILASLGHNLRQLERDARNWEHQANDWKAIADRQRDEITAVYAAQRQAEARMAELRAALELTYEALSETVAHLTGYDWNADPLSLTLKQGAAFAARAALAAREGEG